MFLADIVANCAKHRARPALFIGGRAHTYGELGDRAAAILANLRAHAAPNEYVGIIAHDHVDTYAAIVATLLAGRCYVPVNPTHPPARNRSVVEQSSLEIVFGATTDEAASILGVDVPVLMDGRRCTEGGSLAAPDAPSDALAYLLFTSGSSGEPKGVPISVGNLDAFLRSFALSAPPMDDRDRVLQMFDLTFDFSVGSTFAPLTRGACIYTIPPDVMKFTFIASLLEDERLTQLPLVPSVLTHLRPYFADLQLEQVTHTFFCGEALHADMLEAFGESAPNSVLTNYYGPTEATVFAMYYAWDRAREAEPRATNGVVSIGRAMDAMRAIVLDGDQELVAGEKGELCLAGPQLTPGYFKDPDRNTRAFVPVRGERYYRTGDVARMEEDGTFTFIGRVDHQVKLQGYRVELSEIEHHARILASPSNAVVVDVNAPEGMRLHMFLEGFAGDPATILHGLRDRVPAYMVPSAVVVVATLPLNANGKVDRLALRRMAEGRDDA